MTPYMSRSDDRRKKHDVAAALKKIDIRTSVGRATGRWRWSRARLPPLQPSKKSILRNVLSLLPLCSLACGPFNGGPRRAGSYKIVRREYSSSCIHGKVSCFDRWKIPRWKFRQDMMKYFDFLYVSYSEK